MTARMDPARFVHLVRDCSLGTSGLGLTWSGDRWDCGCRQCLPNIYRDYVANVKYLVESVSKLYLLLSQMVPATL